MTRTTRPWTLTDSHSRRRSRARVASRRGGAWTLVTWIGYSGIAPRRPPDARVGTTIAGRPGPTGTAGRSGTGRSVGRASREPWAGSGGANDTDGAEAVSTRRDDIAGMVAGGDHPPVIGGSAAAAR